MSVTRRWRAAVAALLLCTTPRVASADPASVASLPWLFNGPVRAATRLGDTLYVGGDFTTVAPQANALASVYALNASTGAITAPTFASTDGDVLAVVPDGAGGAYVGGRFTSIGAIAQARLAHLAADGTVDPSFRPVVSDVVTAIVRTGGAVYYLANAKVAAVRESDGAAIGWAPITASPMRVDAVIEANGRIVLGRTFGVFPFQQAGVAAYDATTGAELWAAFVSGGFRGSSWIRALAVDAAHVYVASDVSFTIGSKSAALSKVSLADGAADPAFSVVWPGADVAVTALAVVGNAVYLGGPFTDVVGMPRRHLAAVDAQSAALLPWDPRANGPVTRLHASAGGVMAVGTFTHLGVGATTSPRAQIAEIDASGAVTAWTAEGSAWEIFDVAPAGPSVLVAAGGALRAWTTRARLAAFDLQTGTLLPWTPAANDAVTLLATNGAAIWIGGAFTTMSGQSVPSTAVVDVVNGGLLRVPDGSGTPLFADDTWWYRSTTSASGTRLERLTMATTAIDATWSVPLTAWEGVADADAVYVASDSAVAAYDRRTAALRWLRPGLTVRHLAVHGDTLYAYDPVTGVESLDARTGQPIRGLNSRLANDLVTGLTVADGRLIVATAFGARLSALGLDGRAAAWLPADYFQPQSTRGAELLTVLGDVLLAGGAFVRPGPAAIQGLAVFRLTGPAAPTALRTRPVAGGATEFSWTPATTAPGGYIVDVATTAGQFQPAAPVGNATAIAAVVPPGVFYVRVRAGGAGGASDEVSNEIRVSGACIAPPRPPTALVASLTGPTVSFTWTPPADAVTGYVLAVGSASGAEDIGTLRLGVAPTVSGAAPPGTYFVHVRAVNGCGVSGPSGETFVTVGATIALPNAPFVLSAGVNGGTFALTWYPQSDADGYILEAGTAPGLANLATLRLGANASLSIPGVPPGQYYVRLRAWNRAGSSAPSPDVIVVVP